MKKLLFVIMLMTAANSFTAGKTSQQGRSTNTASRVSQNEKVEIENAVKRGLLPILNRVMEQAISETAKEAVDSLINIPNYGISASVKKRVREKIYREFLQTFSNNMGIKINVKKINFVSSNKAEVVCDIKMKNFEKLAEIDMGDLEKRVLKKLGYNSDNELERIMLSPGNDKLKEKTIGEILSSVISELKRMESDDPVVSDVTIPLEKKNGRWQIENLEQLSNFLN